MSKEFDKLANFAQTYASLENMRENMDMKNLAKEILLEENYDKFIKSYKFMFWFQLVGTLAGFGIPCVVFVLIFQDISYMAFGAAIGILWLPIMFLISMLMPQGRIYRKFAKWYRNRHSTIDELDVIFYKDR